MYGSRLGLAGNWHGEAFGKTFEAAWKAPSAGSMVGLFKLMDGVQVDFYELLTIAAIDGRLGLRVKHFSRDFVAWEDKDGYVFFELLASEPDAAHMTSPSRSKVKTSPRWRVSGSPWSGCRRMASTSVQGRRA